MRGGWGFGRGGAGTDDEFGGQGSGFGTLATAEFLHDFKGGNAEAQFGLAHGGEGNTEVFAEEDVAKTGDGKVGGDADALAKKDVGSAHGDEVVDGLDGRGGEGFVEGLQGGFFPIFEGGAGGEDEAVVGLDLVFTKGAAIAIETLERAGGSLRAAEEGDAFVAQVQEVARHPGAGGEVVRFDVEELGAKWGALAEDDDGDLTLEQFIVNGGGGRQAVGGSNEKAVHAAGEEAADAGFFAFGDVEGLGEDEIATQFVGAFLEGGDGGDEDGIGEAGEDEAKEFGVAAAEALGHGIGHVAQLLGQELETGLGLRGNIRGAAQSLGDGHDGDARLSRDVF